MSGILSYPGFSQQVLQVNGRCVASNFRFVHCLLSLRDFFLFLSLSLNVPKAGLVSLFLSVQVSLFSLSKKKSRGREGKLEKVKDERDLNVFCVDPAAADGVFLAITCELLGCLSSLFSSSSSFGFPFNLWQYSFCNKFYERDTNRENLLLHSSISFSDRETEDL